MRKILLLLCLSLVLFGCGSDGNVVKQDKITIGFIIPLTGDLANWGENVRTAANLAYEQLGALKDKYQILYEDDAFDNKKTVAAYYKLVGNDKATALITYGSGGSNAVAPLAEQDKTIILAIASDPKIVEGRKYVFRHWVTPEAEAKAFIPEILKRDYKRIAVLTTNQQYTIYIKKIVKEQLGDKVPFVVDEVVDPEVKDFRTLLVKANELKADAIWLNLLPGQVGLAARQAKELRLKQDLINVESFEDPKEIENSQGALEGQWYVNADDPSQEFIKAYEARYGKTPGFSAANAYDTVKLLVNAMEKAGTDPDKIVTELHKVKDYPGAVGMLTMDDGNSVQSPATVKVIKDGKFEKLYP